MMLSVLNIPSLIRVMIYLSDSLFIGLKVLIPLLFVLVIFNIRTKYVNIPAATKTATVMLLIGATLFLLAMSINIFTAWYSDNEFERDLMISMLTGPTWYQIVIPILSYGILPMLLWIKNIRASIYISFNIIIAGFIGSLLVNYLSTTTHGLFDDIDWQEMGWKGLVFVVVFFALLNRIQRHESVKCQN